MGIGSPVDLFGFDELIFQLVTVRIGLNELRMIERVIEALLLYQLVVVSLLDYASILYDKDIKSC